ncbi:MAG: N-(5'-phosphoribosyl)anthranilate isomerase, partial [Deltaproteobacteria bacterium]
PADCLLLNDWQIIKAVRIGSGQQFPDLEPYRDCCRLFLFDTHVPGRAGGTGQAFDWQLIDREKTGEYFILAGGLNPDNVGRAIATVHPWVVDVSSGVEREPGRKDYEKIEAFMDAVRRTDEQTG